MVYTKRLQWSLFLSAKSEAWHTMDPKIREFYVSFAQLNTFYCNPFGWNPLYEQKYHFFGFGVGFIGSNGYNIATSQWTSQLWNLGSFEKNSILWSKTNIFHEVTLGPMTDMFWQTAPPNQWSDVTYWGENYPREKYRIRKSYWTGVPRRRRNL
jgi:hypothetical protein